MAEENIPEIISGNIGQPTRPEKPKPSPRREFFIKVASVCIVVTILGLLINLAIYLDNYYSGTITPAAKSQIDSLNGIILRQEILIDQYDKKVADFKIQVDTLQSLKEANTEKINKIKNDYKNKASRVANFDSDSLNSFFSNRYH